MKKEKKLLILSLIAIVLVSSFSIYFSLREPPTWKKTLGSPDNESGFMAINSIKFGYITLGSRTISNDTDVYLLNLDEKGNFIWENTLGGPGNDLGYSIRRELAGGYSIVGKTNSYGSGQYDAWLVKVNENGAPLSNITYGGSGNDAAYSFKTTLDSGYIISGISSSFGSGGSDAYVISTNPSGMPKWQKTYGGTKNDWAKSVIQVKNGSYWILGSTNSFSKSFDFYLINIDLNGNLIFNKTFGGAKSDFGDTVIETLDNNLILSGLTNSAGSGSFDALVIKTTTQGNQIWNKTFGGPGNDSATFIRETSDKGYIIIGDTNSYNKGDSDVFVLKLSHSGTTEWAKIFGGSGNQHASFILETFDNGYLLTGTSTNNKSSDILSIKMNSKGEVS